MKNRETLKLKTVFFCVSGERAGHGHPDAGSRLAQPQQEERGARQVGGLDILTSSVRPREYMYE